MLFNCSSSHLCFAAVEGAADKATEAVKEGAADKAVDAVKKVDTPKADASAAAIVIR